MAGLRFAMTIGTAAFAAGLLAGLPSALAAPASDAHGYLDSAARCAAPATAVVFGSTTTSRVAICELADGEYEYRGVRLADAARLTVPAIASDAGYVAANDGVTYTVSAKSLTVRAGSRVIRTEPMLDFHAAPDGPAQTPADSPPADTPTPSTPLPPPLAAEEGHVRS